MFFKKKPSTDASTVPTMADYSLRVRWCFIVPPLNTRRVIITQRKDGPFRKNTVGGRGYYYVSVETLDSSTYLWSHMTGSLRGGYEDFDRAHRAASERWIRARISLLKEPS